MTRARDNSFNPFNNQVAGKNAVINGAFDFWQRGTSFTVNNNIIYTADRWILLSTNTGGNVVASQQAFTPGSAPVSGYEGSFFLRNTATSPTGASFNVWQHKIEDVRTLAGQTVTLSFWAKADSSRTILSQFFQNFGSGGSTEIYTGTSYPYSLSTSWQRLTTTLTLPSLSGKTVGSGSSLRLEFVLPINVSSIVDIWGVQLELGSSATAFSRSAGTIQGELAACQRYYYKSSELQYSPGTATYTGVVRAGSNSAGTRWLGSFTLPVTMRSAPSAIIYNPLTGTANSVRNEDSNTNLTATIFGMYTNTITQIDLSATAANQSILGYIVASAEL